MALGMPGLGISTSPPTLIPRAGLGAIGAPPPVRVGMTIDQMKGWFFREDRILQKLDAASARAFRKFGSRVRLTARHSLRKQPPGKYAPPGHAPYSHGRHLLRSHIYFALPPDESHVIIGPALLLGRGVGLAPFGTHTVPQVEEFGGMVQTAKAGANRLVFIYTDSAGVSKIRRVKPIKQTASGLLAYDYDARGLRTFRASGVRTGSAWVQKPGRVRRYPKRPYMGPAFKRELPRAQDLWANSVR